MSERRPIIQEKRPPRTKSAFGTIVYPVMDEAHPNDYWYAIGRVCLGEDRKTWCASVGRGVTTGFATRADAEEDVRHQWGKLEAERERIVTWADVIAHRKNRQR